MLIKSAFHIVAEIFSAPRFGGALVKKKIAENGLSVDRKSEDI